MARKKWTPKEKDEVTESVLRLREKRKWQLAYRRYVLEKQPSEAYAYYFGLDNETLRGWFDCQFSEGLHWDNFGKAWQFDHIIPASCFDYSVEEDLLLCWNYINMRVEVIEPGTNRGPGMNMLGARTYFQELYNQTGLSLCKKMLGKIDTLVASNTHVHPATVQFIHAYKERLESIGGLNKEEFADLNRGSSVEDILLEREILRKFSAGPQG